MRFVSFNYIDPFPRAGVLIGGVVIDLAAAAPLVFEGLEDARWQLLDLLRGAPEGMGIDGAADIAAAVLDQIGIGSADELEAETTGDDAWSRGLAGTISIGGAEMALPLDELRLLAPLPRPPSLRDFYAFEQHVETAYRARNRPVPRDLVRAPGLLFRQSRRDLWPWRRCAAAAQPGARLRARDRLCDRSGRSRYPRRGCRRLYRSAI